VSDRDQELVLGVPRARILGDRTWHGILAEHLDGYLDRIASEGEYRARWEAERDPEWQQIIPYLLMRDGQLVFLMRRTRAGGDARLHDLFSIGIGGHLGPGDGSLMGGLAREFHEEMVADWDPEPRLVGLLKDDATPVGRVHLGVVFEADAGGRPLAVRETHKLRGRFVPVEDVLAVYEQLETWSQFVLDHATGRQVGPLTSG
jgi:predicted NUDIX family phosphoesterase